MELTIFTPTYNRAYLLNVLYKSLCNQNNKNFIWLIIDDGSNDNTKELVNNWQKENIIEIVYFYQNNAGKHVAHNKAVELCNTDLFFCVDSDDILSNEAVEIILRHWSHEKSNTKDFIGYCARRGNLLGKPTGKNWISNKKYISLFNLNEVAKFKGETALIWITKVLKQYKFPVIKNESFVTENVLYYQISYTQKMRLLNEIFYLFEYKPDGYTNQGIKLRIKNPYGFALYYLQLSILSKSFVKKIEYRSKFKGWMKVFNLKQDVIYENLKINKTNNILLNILSNILSIGCKIIYLKKINEVQ